MNDKVILQAESGLDWNELWKAEYVHRRMEDDADQEAYWDSRADDFKCHGSSYPPAFLELARIPDGVTVIDMGCATGTLSIPLAARGCDVHACDISGRMLEHLAEQAASQGVLTNITRHKMSWLGDWSELPVAHTFIASRSLVSEDLLGTLGKMEAHASHQCCVTLPTAFSPLHDNRFLAYMGKEVSLKSEAAYLVNLLFSMGRNPRIDYISHVRPTFGKTAREIYESFAREDGPFTADEEPKVRAYIDQNFSFGTDPEGNPTVERAYKRPVHWMFVSWDVPRDQLA